MLGKFITFEGGECTGKTTIIETLATKLRGLGHDVVVTREPGGIKISEKIRNILLDPENKEMTGQTEALLYAASRVQHLYEKVIPALERGAIVISDRYLDSSLVYQGYARNLGIEDVLKVNCFATKYMPDLTLFIDVEPAIALGRLSGRKDKVDRLDQEDYSFHEKVYAGYKEIAKRYPQRIVSIDGKADLEEVTKECVNVVLEYLNA